MLVLPSLRRTPFRASSSRTPKRTLGGTPSPVKWHLTPNAEHNSTLKPATSGHERRGGHQLRLDRRKWSPPVRSGGHPVLAAAHGLRLSDPDPYPLRRDGCRLVLAPPGLLGRSTRLGVGGRRELVGPGSRRRRGAQQPDQSGDLRGSAHLPRRARCRSGLGVRHHGAHQRSPPVEITTPRTRRTASSFRPLIVLARLTIPCAVGARGCGSERRGPSLQEVRIPALRSDLGVGAGGHLIAPSRQAALHD